MRRWKSIAVGVALLATGYLLGLGGAFHSRTLTAQDAEVSENTGDKIQAAQEALQEAADALAIERGYEAVSEDLNAFLVLTGGGNALEDLEGGNGVDPETFAALYAGQATPEVQELLDFNDDGLLTYNGQIVRLYSRSKLARLYATRLALTSGL